jgi:hypothetical protein
MPNTSAARAWRRQRPEAARCPDPSGNISPSVFRCDKLTRRANHLGFSEIMSSPGIKNISIVPSRLGKNSKRCRTCRTAFSELCAYALALEFSAREKPFSLWIFCGVEERLTTCSASSGKSVVSLRPSHPTRGACARHETRGGMRWTRCLRNDERRRSRTAKSRGPGAAMLASRVADLFAAQRWQESPFTGESAK